MNSITYREYRLMPYFVIALILHLLYLLVWAYGTTIKNHVFELLDIPQTQETAQQQSEDSAQTEDERIAALKTRYSEFGAPVSFQEEPEFTQEAPFARETQTLEDEKKDQEQSDSPSEPTESAQESQPQPGEKPEEHPGTISQVQSESQPVPEKVVKKVQPRVSKPQQPRKPQLPPRVSSDRLAGPEMKNAAPVKKELTFADIANGFLDTVRDEGGFDFVSREGDESIRPSYEEMKYLSYHQKVAWHIQNSWRRYMNLVDDKVPDTANISFLLVIDKDGFLKDVRIEQSTGYHSLDQLLLRTVKDAGPFPPLPEHFKTDKYDLRSSWVYYRETAPRGRGRFAL